LANPAAAKDIQRAPERSLPECRFHGRQNKKLQFAVLAATALQGGTEPDLLDEVAWWQTYMDPQRRPVAAAGINHLSAWDA
jgi:hypothetical protein